MRWQSLTIDGGDGSVRAQTHARAAHVVGHPEGRAAWLAADSGGVLWALRRGGGSEPLDRRRANLGAARQAALDVAPAAGDELVDDLRRDPVTPDEPCGGSGGDRRRGGKARKRADRLRRDDDLAAVALDRP